jgi:putative glutamine amidotransferase
MRIALSQRVVENSSYPERRDALDQEWAPTLAHVLPDAALVPVPNALASVQAWAESIAPDALVLTGGNDWGTAPERDRTETELVDWCRTHRRPILGVCRGLHVINALLGGGLCTDLQARSGEHHVARDHAVAITGGAFEAWADSPGRSLVVNSFHEQGVLEAQLAEGLRAFALSGGGVVEGLVHASEPILAVQWHPERANPGRDFDLRLLTAFFERGAFWSGK